MDLAGKTAVICQQLQQYDGRLAICPPKTPRSIRVIALDHTTVAALHDLRHGAAALALAAGVDLRVVQDMLGHSSIVLTADTYTSVLPAVAHTAAEQVATLIIRVGCLVPGTRQHRRRQSTRNLRRARARQGGSRTKTPPRSKAHPARQIGRPRQRKRTR